MIMEDPNKYVGSVFVWEEQKVKEIMQDIVNFTKQSDNNINWNKYDTRRKSKKI
jgi:hypothetical protein